MTSAVALMALLFVGAVEPAGLGPPGVSLEIDDCPALPRAEVARLLALEIGAPVLSPDQAGERTERVQVTCSGEAVLIAIADPAKGISLTRANVVPSANQDVFVRLVAIAISELVLASRGELSFEKPPVARAELAPAPPPPAVGPPASAGSATLLVVGQALGPFAGVGVGWGGGLRLGWAFGRPWAQGRAGRAGPALDLELGAARAAVDSTLGGVQVSLWSATLRGSLRFRRGRAWLDAGGGGRFGLAQIEGQPLDATIARGSAIAGTWAGPVAYLGAGARFGHLVVAAGVEAGHVLRSVTGLLDEGTPVAVSGSWACGTLAAGWGE
jgi:hypothetical protein